MCNSATSIERHVPAREENDRGDVVVEKGGSTERGPEDVQQEKKSWEERVFKSLGLTIG